MKISDIKMNPNNPRKIEADRFDKLKKSIKEFPKMLKLRPLVINSDNIVLGGNMRLKALHELGYKEIPNEWVKRADELTEDEQRRFIISDNVGFGEHDWELLNTDWDVDELEDWGLDVPDWHNEEIEDIDEIEEFSESVNFTIKCDNLEQFEELQAKLSVSTHKLSYQDFINKVEL